MARRVHQFWCERAIMIQRTRLSSRQWKVNTGLIDTSFTHLSVTLTMVSPPFKFTVWCVPMRILVAEHDAPLAEFLHQRLQQEQFSVQMVADSGETQRLASDQPYDFVILDLNLPADAGLELLRNIRAKKPDLPVLVVTAANLAEERVRLLDAGADDYLARPFAFAELAARIRAVLRRGGRPARALLKIGDLEIDRVAMPSSVEVSPSS